MVTTKEKPIVNTQKNMRQKFKHTAKESQTTNKDGKWRKKERNFKTERNQSTKL